MDRLRKWVALFSVLLLLSAVRCMANCIASDAGSPPPCHKHHAPVKACPNHSEVLALSFQSVLPPVTIGTVVYQTWLKTDRAAGFVASTDSPPVPRPPSLSSLVLRI